MQRIFVKEAFLTPAPTGLLLSSTLRPARLLLRSGSWTAFLSTRNIHSASTSLWTWTVSDVRAG